MEEPGEHQLRITKNCNISTGVVDFSTAQDENYIKGGILSNSKLSWVSCGPRITTINNDDGSKRTGWTFGWSLSDPSYKVVCVEELPMGSFASPILVVACERELNGSSLCFYHSGSSRMLKAIHFTDKITSLGVVSKADSEEERLSGLLKAWNGVIAVGTNSGKVYLLDAWWKGLQKCIEDYHQNVYDEQKQSKLVEVTLRDLENNVQRRNNSIRHGSSTVALWLNEETLQRQRSPAHPGVQNILGRMPREFLTVSALHYFPQISTLAVGYNTSCFQLWDLSSLTILYTSALLEAMLPVYSFALLEPSDDPRYVCYLWSLHHSVDEDNLPFAGMYLLHYREKHLSHYNMMSYYQGFSLCSIRYQLDLGMELDNMVSGRIISSHTLHRSHTKPSPAWLEGDQEETSGEEGTASMLTIVWEVWDPNQLATVTRLTLFDLNQWYRECMPQSSDIEYSRFMVHFCLPDGPLLDVRVLQSSVQQFFTLQPVDEHFYPTATTFECVCLQQTRVLSCVHQGTQELCLQAIQDGGPSSLLLPSRLYKLCTQAGIKPLLVDISSPNSSHSKEQREYLLCVVLEYGMTGFLRSCVRDWSDGSHTVAGCTLPSLLQWAWGRVDRYKKCLDGLCIPLFDYSGTALDSNNLGLFHHLICQLHNLQDLFHLVLDKYRNYILQDNYQQQHTALRLVTAFYDAVLWCVRHKLLPETNASDNHTGHIPYFTDKIVNSTIARRAELHQVARSLKQPAPPTGLMLIDAVIAQEGAGDKLTDQWEREGGTTTVGKYPPPSVQSLLRSYLVRGIPDHIKHFIVTYFLHDVINILSTHSLNESAKQKLLSYPSNFGLSESQCKVVHAFWCLDHSKFEEGVSLLLDEAVNKEDIQLYQHRTVICLLIASGHHKLALHYLNIRKPGLVDPQDIRMKMTLLLVNGLIHEAFEFQRHHNSCRTELLQQFFTGCVEMNKLDVVFKLPLNPAEEEAFMTFLEKTSHPQSDDLSVLYLLSRSRYVEAIDMNEKLRSKGVSRRKMPGLPIGLSPRSRSLFGPRDEAGAPAQAVLTTRDLLINSVAKSLPSVTRDLADYCTKEKSFKWSLVTRPTPLSVVVHTDLSAQRLPFYKSPDSLVVKALSKTRETWAPLLQTPVALRRKLSSTVEDTPFLRTPLLSRLSNLSPLPEGKPGVRCRGNDGEENSRAKRARLEFSPSIEQTTHGAEEMDITCPESCALLHTPLVSRVVKQPREVTTPHSILKGSANNTPVTPGKSGKSLVASVVSRQIRFSLPSEEQSPTSSTISSMANEEEEDRYSPTVSPRKSIHELSDVKCRKGTPANPRIQRNSYSLRSSATKLSFLDADITNKEATHVEPSATAGAILKTISTSPGSSEEAYFSFRSSSSSSQKTKSIDSTVNFNLSIGLEGNIDENETDESEENQTENEDVSVQDQDTDNLHHTDDSTSENVSPIEVPAKIELSNKLSEIDIPEYKLQTSITVGKTVLKEILKKDSKVIQPKSPEEIKIVIESKGTSKFINKTKVVDYDTTGESFDGADSSVEETATEEVENETNDTYYKPVYKWTKDLDGKCNESLQLEVTKPDEKGVTTCVAKVTVSEEIPLFYSESIGTSIIALNNTSSATESDELQENLYKSSENQLLITPGTESELHKLETTVVKSKPSKEIEVAEKLALSKTNEIKDQTKNEKLEKSQILLEKFNIQSETVKPTSPIDKSQLPQILEEIINRGRISVNLTEIQKSFLPKSSVVSLHSSQDVENEISVVRTDSFDKASERMAQVEVKDSMEIGSNTNYEENCNVKTSVNTTKQNENKSNQRLFDSDESIHAIVKDCQSSPKKDTSYNRSKNTIENVSNESEISLSLESSIHEYDVPVVTEICSTSKVLEESELNSQSTVIHERKKESAFVTDSANRTSQDQSVQSNFVTNLARPTTEYDKGLSFIEINKSETSNYYERESGLVTSSHVEVELKEELTLADTEKPKTVEEQKEEFGKFTCLEENENLFQLTVECLGSTTPKKQSIVSFSETGISATSKGQKEEPTFITPSSESLIVTTNEVEELKEGLPVSCLESGRSATSKEQKEPTSPEQLIVAINKEQDLKEDSTVSFSEYKISQPSIEQKEEPYFTSTSDESLIVITNEVKELEEGATADFDLQMPEDEVEFEKEDSTTGSVEIAVEPLFENLNPVPFYEEEINGEDITNYDQYDKDHEEEEEEDIYADMEEKEDSIQDEEDKSEKEKENDSDVICLGSSSDEEPPEKSLKFSTSQRKCSVLSKHTTGVNETLDYEDDDDDDDDDDDENDEENYSDEGSRNSSNIDYDSYSEIESQELNTDKIGYSDSSEDNGHHGNRSWKLQRNVDENEASLEKEDECDEDTIESPPYELIGQDSQSNDIADDKLPKTSGTIETSEDIEGKTLANNEYIKPSIDHSPPVLDDEEVDNSRDKVKENTSKLEDDSINVVSSDIEDSIAQEHAVLVPSDSILKETFEPILSELPKTKCHVETGSILDLKLRRSKRYSSSSNLSASKKAKLRRRSNSAHDITSLIISEFKSASGISDVLNSSSSPSNESENILPLQLPSVEPILCDERPLNPPKKSSRSSCLSQLPDITEENQENSPKYTKGHTDKPLKRSLSVNQLEEQRNVEGTPPKRSSSGSRLSEYIDSSELELQTNTVQETCKNKMSLSNDTSMTKLKKRWTLEMEAMKYITRKKRRSSVVSDSLEVIHSSDEEETGKSKSRNLSTQFVESGTNDPSIALVEEEDNHQEYDSTGIINTNDINSHESEPEVHTSIHRFRSQSVPPTLENSDAPRLSIRRRSSSLMKIENFHRKVLRNSLKNKSLRKSTFEPLEIVHSDEEIIGETSQNKTESVENVISLEENTKDKNKLVNEFNNANMDFCNENVSIVEPLTVSNSGRNLRCSSEPPNFEDMEIPKRVSKRKSSSSHKINEIHKLILPRHSHRKSVYSNNFQPMEVVQSDDENSIMSKNIDNPGLEMLDKAKAGEKGASRSRKSSVDRRSKKKKLNFDKDDCETEDFQEDNQDQQITIDSKSVMKAPQSTSDGEPVITSSTVEEKCKKIQAVDKEKVEEKNLINNTDKPFEGEKHIDKVEDDVEEMVISHVISTKKHRNPPKKDLKAILVEDDPLPTKTDSGRVKKLTKKTKTKRKKTKEISTNNDSKDIDSLETKSEVLLKNTNEEEHNVTVKEPSASTKPVTHKKTKKLQSKNKKTSTDIPRSESSETVGKKNVTPPNLTSKVLVEHAALLLDSPAGRTRSVSRTIDKDLMTPTKEHEVFLLDSPARRTRRSMSRVSDTELLTPTIERGLLEQNRRTRRSSAMSDIVLSTPNKHTYAESEASDTSTSSRLTTPRRSNRRRSFTATSNTPGDVIPEDYLAQRRLTRNQHSQLQKSFELSLSESPKVLRLENLPEEEEGDEEDTSTNLTPVRSSTRNVTKTPTRYSSKSAKSKTSRN